MLLFEFRLALALGCTRQELMQRVGSHELIYWLAFYKLDPWGGYRQDVNAANIAATLANINRGRDSTPYDLDDFMLFNRSFEEKIMTNDQIAAQLASIFGR